MIDENIEQLYLDDRISPNGKQPLRIRMYQLVDGELQTHSHSTAMMLEHAPGPPYDWHSLSRRSNMKTISALLLTGLIASTSLPVGAYGIYGVGNKPCSLWTSERANTETDNGNINWILGFVTASARSENQTYNLNAEQMINWIDKYCKLNTEWFVYDAAAALVGEMEKQVDAAQRPK